MDMNTNFRGSILVTIYTLIVFSNAITTSDLSPKNSTDHDTPPPPERCHYVPETSPEFTICSVFGQLHLTRSNASFERCHLVGARPLIDSPFLSIQITIQTVKTFQFIRRAVIVVKGVKGCLEDSHNTYSASATTPLPVTFDNGLKSLGGSVPDTIPLVSVSLVGKRNRQHINMTLRHLNTSIVLRRFEGPPAPTLSLSLRIPDNILGDTGLQLCSTGCPLHAPLARSSDRSLRAAQTKCRSQGLLDGFLDACVSDVSTLTTEEDEIGGSSFLNAARFAYDDSLTMHPQLKHFMQNRTVYLWDSSGTKCSQQILLILPFVCITLFIPP